MTDRTTLLALASRVEAATGADRELDAAIDCAVRLPDLRPAQPDDFDGKYGYSAGNIKCEHGFLMSYRYTASLDAAMSLPPSGQAQEVLRHAMAALGKRFDLHIKFWPKDQNYTEWLARFVTAASLRAIAGGMAE